MLKVCIIGCGRVAYSHVEGAKEIGDKVKIVAAVNSNIEKAYVFQKKYGIPHAFATFEEAEEAVDFDAVDICLPNYLHKDMAIKCAKAGKHVLVEKPMANNTADCLDMVEAADAAGVTLMVGQSRRFYNAVMKSKTMVDAGDIGKLISISANLYAYMADAATPWWKEAYKAGGLIIPMWGSHIIDYCLWMFGEMPKRIYCEAYSINPNWEGEDETTLVLGFTDDRFATIRMSWNTRRKKDAVWEGSERMLASSDVLYERYIQGTTGSLYLNDETELFENGSPVELEKQKISNFAWQYTEFADAIAEKRESLTSGRVIVNVIRVQEAALESAATHKVIEL